MACRRVVIKRKRIPDNTIEMGKLSLCAARLYQRDLNIEGRYFRDQRFNEAFNSPFAGVIDAAPRKGNLTADAGDLEDTSASLRAQMWQRSARNLDRAYEICRQLLRYLLVTDLLGSTEQDKTCVVYNHIDRS